MASSVPGTTQTPSSETSAFTPPATTTSSSNPVTPTTTSSTTTPFSSTTTSTSTPSTSTTSTSTTTSSSSTSSTTSTVTTTSSSQSIPVVTKTLTTEFSTSSPTPTTSTTSPVANGHAGGFFANKGAVAGVFTVVGLIGLALVALLFVTFMKQRRARALDKEIAAAAAEANFQAGRAQFEDDEFNGDPHSGQSYYSASAGTHGAFGQQPMSNRQWDTYNAASYGDHPAVMNMGSAAYPMQTTRSLSAGTGASAGMAGFGVAAAHGNGAGDPNAGFYGGPRSTGHDGAAPYGYPQAQPQPVDYYGPYGQAQLPPAAGPAAVAGQPMVQPEEKYDDAYGGEIDEYDDTPAVQQPQRAPEVHRQDSNGTYHDDDHEMQPRTLKVANE